MHDRFRTGVGVEGAGWIRSFRRPLWIGLGLAILVALATLPTPNYYRSEACILPGELKGAGSGLGGLASTAAAFGIAIPGGDGSDANFVDILSSRTLREKLVVTPYTFKQATWRFGKAQERSETLQTYFGTSNLDRTVGVLSKVLSVARDPKSKVILISAETKSPELSQLIVKQAIKLLEDFIQKKGQTRGGAKAAFAEARLVEARFALSQAQSELTRFLDGNRNYQASSDPSVKLAGMRLEGEFKLRQQLVTTLSLNLEQALMDEKNDLPILNILDAGNLPIEKSGPKRSQLVIAAFLLGTISSWLWLNRGFVRERFASDDDPTVTSSPTPLEEL